MPVCIESSKRRKNMTNTNEKALKMLKTALEMEEKGRRFYEQASASCQNTFGRDMFRNLAQDEVAHAERIKKIFASLEADRGWTDEWMKFGMHKDDLIDMFYKFTEKNGKLIKADTKDLEALDIAIDMEEKAIAFYDGYLKSTKDLVERAFLEKMVVEERTHFAIIRDTKFYLTDPEGWFFEHEKHSCDGG